MPGETRRRATAQEWTQFEATILPHLEATFRLARWLTRDREEAQDLVQETFSQALQSFHRFTPGTNARAWVLTILRHLRNNRLRGQRRLPATVDVDEAIDRLPAVQAPPQHLTDEEVLGALATLPPAFQEVVLLTDVEELSYKEVAGILEVPLGTVMSRLHRARRLLRAALMDYAVLRGVAAPPADGAAGGRS